MRHQTSNILRVMTFVIALFTSTGCISPIPEYIPNDADSEVGDTPDMADTSDTDVDVIDIISTPDMSDNIPDINQDTPDMVVDPCAEVVTPQGVATYLGEVCSQMNCSANPNLTRAEFITVLMGYVPISQLQGYTGPDEPVDQAYWLDLLDSDSLSLPNDPASVCWTEPILDLLQVLPMVYAVALDFGITKAIPANWFYELAERYTVHFPGPVRQLVQEIRVVNNPSGDFTTDVPQDALAQVQLRCLDPEQGAPTEYYITPVGGVATFDVDCFDQNGDGLILEVAVRSARDTEGADTGDQIRIAIDPTSLTIRGDWVSQVPTHTIE